MTTEEAAKLLDHLVIDRAESSHNWVAAFVALGMLKVDDASDATEAAISALHGKYILVDGQHKDLTRGNVNEILSFLKRAGLKIAKAQ